MLEKNKEREARKHRKLWVGYYSRLGPSKKDRIEREDKKNYYKQLKTNED